MKVVVTARNFSTDDDTALKMLIDAGFEVSDHSAEDLGSGTDEKYIMSLIENADAVICGPEKNNQSSHRSEQKLEACFPPRSRI